MKDVIEILTKLSKTISTMESCTGGGIANAITNIEGASNVFKFGAVTYSNEYKIKMGVDSNLIEKYSVYSMEVAKSMSKAISDYTSSDYGISITGKINREDNFNKFNLNDIIYVSIYEKSINKYHIIELKAIDKTRGENKEMIINNIVSKLLEIL